MRVNATQLVLFALVAVLIITPVITQGFAEQSKVASDKMEQIRKQLCDRPERANDPACAKYRNDPVKAPQIDDPIAFQKQQLQQKIDAIVKQEQVLAKQRDVLGETEYMKQYNALEKQIESLELKIAALDSGRNQPVTEQETTCDKGMVLDSFGNCVTMQQKKMTQMKSQKGSNPQTIDDVEALKQENAKLKTQIDSLQKQIDDLTKIVQKLQSSIAKLIS